MLIIISYNYYLFYTIYIIISFHTYFTLSGDMHYIHGVAAKNLEATEVNELVVRDMLTLTTDQHVRSRLAAEKISLAPRRKHQDYRKGISFM